MSHIAKRSTVVVLGALLCVALAPSLSPGQGGQSPLVPPQSHAFGESFQDWNVLWSQRAIEVGLAGGTDIGETIDRVRLLPNSLSPGTFDFDVTLPPGTPFVDAP